MAHGTVKFFKPDKGYGAITSPDLPAGFDAWVHFSAIEMEGYRSLNAGDPVEFDYEPAEQDSFRFIATASESFSEYASRAGPETGNITRLSSSCHGVCRALIESCECAFTSELCWS